VTFHGIGITGGDVQVTATDPSSTCAVDSWGVGADLTATVDCYDAAGAAHNEDFSILVTQPRLSLPTPAGMIAYDWVYTGSGNLTGAYQFNSAHKTNSVTHPTIGQYVVTMPGASISAAGTGTVKVSAYGAGAGSCQIIATRTVTAGEQIAVGCFNAAGVPTNRDFTVLYAQGNNLMGQNGLVDANATANGIPTLYQPSMQFDSQTGARVTVVHLDRGFYEVIFVGTLPTHHPSGGLGDLQITPVGTTYTRCGGGVITTHEPWALVSCSSPGGPVNTAFTVQLVFN